MLGVQRFVFNCFHENTYLIWDDQTRMAAVIDPGMYEEAEQNVFNKFVQTNELKLTSCVITHCHIDHVLGIPFIKNEYNVPVLIPQKEMPLLEMLEQQAALFGLKISEKVVPDEFITENTKLELGSISGKYLSTPGHTVDEYCIYFDNERILFSGDVLFQQSIGRTDLWGGDQEILLQSIKTKLYSLPDDVKVYPGHESATTIGFEKKNNPYVAV